MSKLYLFLILFLGFLVRVVGISQPANYIFDEVYHVPSLRAFSQNNPDAFDVYAKAPEENTAYDWLHPPLAKLFQAGSVFIFGDNSFGWRFPAAAFGTLAAFGAYFLAVSVLKSQTIGLLAALIFTLDNLQLTMSRIAMNDIFVTAWILFALAFFYRKQWLWAAVFTGLAISTKHSAVLLGLVFIFWGFILQGRTLFTDKVRPFQYLLVIPPLIYLLSFSQFWLQGHTWNQFVELHRQIIYYQTHLEATHSYQSAAWQWPLLIRPVWFHVQYLPDKIANIYNLGNPLVFWLGVIALGRTLLFTDKVRPFQYLVLAYLSLWLPFAFSPRIMFLHHYLPGLGVLTVILADWLNSLNCRWRWGLLAVIVLAFIWIYPLNTAIALPTDWLKYWFVVPSWR